MFDLAFCHVVRSRGSLFSSNLVTFNSRDLVLAASFLSCPPAGRLYVSFFVLLFPESTDLSAVAFSLLRRSTAMVASVYAFAVFFYGANAAAIFSQASKGPCCSCALAPSRNTSQSWVSRSLRQRKQQPSRHIPRRPCQEQGSQHRTSSQRRGQLRLLPRPWSTALVLLRTVLKRCQCYLQWSVAGVTPQPAEGAHVMPAAPTAPNAATSSDACLPVPAPTQLEASQAPATPATAAVRHAGLLSQAPSPFLVRKRKAAPISSSPKKKAGPFEIIVLPDAPDGSTTSQHFEPAYVLLLDHLSNPSVIFDLKNMLAGYLTARAENGAPANLDDLVPTSGVPLHATSSSA